MKQINKALAALKLTWVASQAVVAPQLILHPCELAYAANFATLEEARKAAFPDADRFDDIRGEVEVREETKIQKVYHQKEFLGFFVFDAVIGKHLLIDYVASFDQRGVIKRVEILTYRENYGAQVAEENWLHHFVGMDDNSFKQGAEIPNITGASYSAKHVTEGVEEIAGIVHTLLSKES